MLERRQVGSPLARAYPPSLRLLLEVPAVREVLEPLRSLSFFLMASCFYQFPELEEHVVLVLEQLLLLELEVDCFLN